MRKIFLTVVALMMFICQSAFAEPSPQWVKNLPAAKTSEQMVIVAGISQTTAWISMHEKINGDWQMIMSTPGFIGKSGLGKVRAGDHKTPVGTFRFDCAFGIAPDPTRRLTPIIIGRAIGITNIISLSTCAAHLPISTGQQANI